MNQDPLRPGTFKEWREVLRREQASLSPGGKLRLAWTLLKAVFGLGASIEVWNSRMLTCPTCPIFDASLQRCRPFDNSPLGCGCYVKFLGKLKKNHCWARKHFPQTSLGWKD